MRPALLALFAVVAAATAGCATERPMYHWNGYDQHLYDHYKHPQDADAWVASMREVVVQAEQQGRSVPPGIYAEYGYALFEQGDAAAAITWFEKERQTWPESSALMDKMIQNARRAPRREAPAVPVRPSQAPVEPGATAGVEAR